MADIAKFCKAMDIFADVNEKVKPKIDEVNKLNTELSKAMAELAVKEANLKKVEDQLETLITTYKAQQSELTGLEEKKKRTKVQLENAEKLIRLTKDEAERWKIIVANLDQGIFIIKIIKKLSKICLVTFSYQ